MHAHTHACMHPISLGKPQATIIKDVSPVHSEVIEIHTFGGSTFLLKKITFITMPTSPFTKSLTTDSSENTGQKSLFSSISE